MSQNAAVPYHQAARFPASRWHVVNEYVMPGKLERVVRWSSLMESTEQRSRIHCDCSSCCAC